jgi:cytochrome b involved in lipid metabolism
MKNFGRYMILSMTIVTGSNSLLAEQQTEFTREELSKHNSKSDCWISIDNEVYDITAAVQDHLRYKYPLDSWCGKEASEAWHNKDGKNKTHSRKAQLMLKELRKGQVKVP